MPICIAGMHRSGTSLVARLLNVCGVYLGPESELLPGGAHNLAGHWENVKFLDLNSEILDHLGGGWDYPPAVTKGWQVDEGLAQHRARASTLLQEFRDHEPWGWKDPRNSLTLPFWRALIPDLKTVICLRDPEEVARSLQKRGNSSIALGLNLWFVYNLRLLEALRPTERLITHYDAYFEHPQGELRRILQFLGIPVTDAMIESACSAVQPSLRHNKVAVGRLTPAGTNAQIAQFYSELCSEIPRQFQPSTYAPSDHSGLPTQLSAERTPLRLGSTLGAMSHERARNLETQLAVIWRSKSWRLTRPLREVMAALRKLRRQS